MRIIIQIICLLILFSDKAAIAREIWLDNKDICENQRGVWREFGSSCAGSCKNESSYAVFCSSASVYGCDCGENRCWEYNQCTSITTYQTKLKKQQEIRTKQRLLEEKTAAKKRQQSQKYLKPTSQNTNLSQNKTIAKQYQQQKYSASSLPKPTYSSEQIALDEITLCTNKGGLWKAFDNRCTDSCSGKKPGILCASITTFGCDCGQNKCWDNNKCIDIKLSSYSKK